MGTSLAHALILLLALAGQDAGTRATSAAPDLVERDRRLHALGGLRPQEQLEEALALAPLYPPSALSAHLWQTATGRYREAGRVTEASECLAHARRDLEAAAWESPGARSAGFARWHLEAAKLDLELGLVDRAALRIPVLEAGREQMAGLEDPAARWFVSNAALTLARIDVARHRWAELERWLPAALETGSLTGDDRARALYLVGQATYEVDPSDAVRLERARARVREAIDAARARESIDPPASRLLRAQAHLRLARFALDRGELSGARAELDVARAIEDAAPSDHPLRALERAHRAVFELRLARRTGDARRAGEELLERWRALLETWHRAAPRPGGVGYLTYENHQRVLGEVLAVLVEKSEEAAWRELVDAHRAATLVKQRLPELLAGEVEAPRPRPGEALWAILPTLDGAHVFLAVGERVEHHWIAEGAQALRRDALALARLVRTSPLAPEAPRARRRGIEELGALLHAKLFPAPFDELVEQASALTVVGAELLEHVPFEVLGPDASRALGRTHDLAYLPCLALHGRLAPEGEEGGALDLACLGGGGDLSIPRAWPARLRDLYPAGRALVSARADATLGDLERVAPRVLQLLGHGHLDREAECPATIEVGGARVDHALLSHLAPVPELVLLTACGSWRGPWRPGDGGVGELAGACLAAGASSVVLTSADVELGATLAWSEVFHWAIARGLSPARAAREARLALAGSATFDDPYYHSLLHVVGDGLQPVFAAPLASAPRTRPDPAAGGAGWRWVLASAGALLGALAVRRALNRRRDQAAGWEADRSRRRPSRRRRSGSP